MLSGNIEDLIQDRDNDGVADYLNARIFVPDDPSPVELASASNVAARLAFEVLSLDLPLAYPVSAYDSKDPRIPIFIGRATASATGVYSLLLPTPDEADRFARDYRQLRYSKVSRQEITSSERAGLSIENFLELHPPLVIGPELKCIAVIDLAARIGLESTTLKLPLAMTADGELPDGAVLIGNFKERTPGRLDNRAALPDGHGRIERIDGPGMGIIIDGADDAGEAEAVRHAAQRLPYVWEYGKSNTSLEAIAVEVRRRLNRPEIGTDTLVFEKTAHLPWEVDAALRRLEEVVISRIRHGSQVAVELRLSEPPSIRYALKQKILKRLVDCGANPALVDVNVLSAYKQGYSWISETLMPHLKGAHRVCIRFRALVPDVDSVDSPIRWLQELYPIDEVLARDLGIPPDHIRFERMPDDALHIYELLIEDVAGRQRVVGTFNPRRVTRPLFDRFPESGHALVTTGGIRAVVDRKQVVDERIETDPERFWTWYQKEVLGALGDHLIGLYGGRIDPGCTPHFGSLEIDLELSEPDYKIHIDEERISTLEALHEDIYFETLLFLDTLGRNNCDQPLTYCGRIIPKVVSTDGPGSVHVRLTGKQEPGMPWRTIKTPEITGIEVAAGRRGLVSLNLRVATEYEHTNPAQLSYPDVAALTLTYNDRIVELKGSSKLDPAGTISEQNQPSSTSVVVQWNSPIGPDECEHIIAQLASYREIHRYRVGTSYLGRTIWALDVRMPVAGRYFSQAKASIEKAVLLITGRQHANEVSSTSHILRLAELLASHSEHKKLLERVIFVLHPMTNPDGAQLVDELRRINPGMMLHACYFGALGVDVTDKFTHANPIYPEAEIRPWLIRTWKPSVVLNPHGYPSHEWVQLFAGYSAWVRSQRFTARDWWIPRGWFIAKLEYTEPQKEWVFGLLASLSQALGPATAAMNERMRHRYRKYGAFDEGTYCMSFQDNLLVKTKQNDSLDPQQPLEIVTEVPDEVAEGSWLQAMAEAGLECSIATGKYLFDWSAPPQRVYCESARETVFCLRRPFAFARTES